MTAADDGILVGLDAGGSYVKATAFDLADGTAITASRPVAVDHPQPGHSERDPEELWAAAGDVIRRALADSKAHGKRVVAVGVTAHGNGAYLVDRDGRPTRPAIQATDTRANELVSRWERDGVPDALRPAVWNGLWPGQPGPILAWLLEHEPEILRGSAALLMCGDYLRGRLSGVLAAELTAWSCNGLVDCVRGELSGAAMAAYGIESLHALVPPLVRADTTVGEVTSTASRLTGLPTGVPVIAGAVDNVALHLGAGVLDGSRIVVGAGTWSINQLCVPRATMTLDGSLGKVMPYAACLALPDTMALLIEASATSASTLDWAMQRVTHAAKTAARQASENVYMHVLSQAVKRPRRRDAPMFLPYLNGSRDQPAARGAWLGLSSSEDDIDLLGATIEGICLEHRRHVERLSRATSGILPLRLAGGAARSPIWAQIFADTTGRTIEVSPVEELGAVGAAVIAGSATGVFTDLHDGLAHLNPHHRTFEPDPTAVSFYDARFNTYCQWARAMEADPWATALRS